MLPKKMSGEVRPASYLSPKERQRAVLLIKAIRASKNVDDLLKYQIQLDELIEKANANKAEIREHARALKGQNIAEVKAHLRSKNNRRTVGDRNNVSMSAGN